MKGRTMFRTRVIAALGAVVLALAGCAGGVASADAVPTLRWAVTLPAHWDPVVSGSGAQFRILSLAYASLTEINEKGEAVPGLAESWTYNEAGDQVTFHLRPNLTFSDGTPLNAAAVKSYLERAKTQKDSALFGDLTSIKSVSASGDRDVVVDLTQVDYQIPLLLGERVAQISSPNVDPAALDRSPVGAGPFKVVEKCSGLARLSDEKIRITGMRRTSTSSGSNCWPSRTRRRSSPGCRPASTTWPTWCRTRSRPRRPPSSTWWSSRASTPPTSAST